jgi:hypothetical protein
MLNSLNCLQVSNGLTKFLNSNSSDFTNNCIVNINYEKLNILVFPNPFKDAIYVKFKNIIYDDSYLKISVINNIGQVIRNLSVYQNLLFSGYRIQLNELPNGIYFLQICSSKSIQTFKIIKNE